ncbi:MAG TPA: RNA-binding protein [Candidatus Binatia bacterium]|nr:RNA-binding protein [Candidatus Binatia bacterium]
MAKRIYVGNLPYDATEDQVRELFAEYGTVESVVMINDRETGRFRGFCFVEMEDAAAGRAIDALDGEEVGGRPLKVNEARPREDRGDRRGGGSGGGNRGQRGSRERRGPREGDRGRNSDRPYGGGRSRR